MVRPHHSLLLPGGRGTAALAREGVLYPPDRGADFEISPCQQRAHKYPTRACKSTLTTATSPSDTYPGGPTGLHTDMDRDEAPPAPPPTPPAPPPLPALRYQTGRNSNERRVSGCSCIHVGSEGRWGRYNREGQVCFFWNPGIPVIGDSRPHLAISPSPPAVEHH